MTDAETTPPPQAAEGTTPQTDALGARTTDQVNGPSSTIGIGTGIGLGCLGLIILLVVFGFVARSVGWL